MRTFAETYKPLVLIVPQQATATVTGSAVAFEPNNDSTGTAVAVAQTGATAGTPTSFTVIYTVTQSATSGGSYTTTATFATSTTANQVSTLAMKLDTSKPYIKGVATIAFVSGTTPSIGIAMTLLVRQNNGSASNATAFS